MREPLHDMLTKLARTRRVRRRLLHADRRHGQHHLQLHRNKILDEVALQLCAIAHDSRPALRMFVPVPVPSARRGESACAKWIQNDEIDLDSFLL